MPKIRKQWLVFIGLLVIAASFRVVVAHRWPNDTPDDGRMYAQIARNVLEQHVYSHETEAPYDPSFIRLPGYPLFLASIYSVFGHSSNGVVRFVQALIDTAACGLVALLAFYWQPDEKRKRASAIAALALAAVCPFTTIYAATILTEVPTSFLALAMFLAATIALRYGPGEETEAQNEQSGKRPLLWWFLAGLCGGLGVLFRPDSGLFVLGVGLTLAIIGLMRLKLRWQKTLIAGTVFSVAFILVLVPWTIRNARVFHVFQPLAPAHGEMPGEFVPRGYNQWLRTWLDDEAYIAPFLWSLNDQPISIDDVPGSSFDSAEEKARVEALLEQYDHPAGAKAMNSSTPTATPSPSPAASPSNSKPAASTKDSQSPTSPKNANANSNSNADESDENDNSADQNDESDNTDESDEAQDEPHGPVEMTPEIDAAFGQIARERIARHPFRYYVWLPIKRARTMWFDTHSQYWPFEGTLLPLDDLDYEHHQQIWLPLFAGLTGLYTILGLAGAWLLWDSRQSKARQWLLLISLAIVLRLLLFSSIENPEPRYLVEFFPLLAALGGIATARVTHGRNRAEKPA
jgi:4-amino-4-deoxy-L-arabinose transferase-like glycosyltransferase